MLILGGGGACTKMALYCSILIKTSNKLYFQKAENLRKTMVVVLFSNIGTEGRDGKKLGKKETGQPDLPSLKWLCSTQF